MTIEKINTEKQENAEISFQYFGQSKNSLRHIIQDKLRVHSSENNLFSSIICTRLKELEIFQVAGKKDRLMIYLSIGNEVQTIPFLMEYSVVVPYCEANTIIPVRIFSRNDLEPGRFGILEPKQSVRNDVGHLVTPEQLDVIIVPGLAFDTLGNRLGRGKGYYDRFLSSFSSNIISIGLAFEYQIVYQVPVNHWDCPVSMIVTEQRIIYPNKKN
ncbi:MAG: 5-formyltetrahydrofolate cyclo-ligase [Planctomycetaceae bacterium]|jgi:5-formyltetrahydrofolate cyclo-ligase|nr:5-formyltetrahydrofolate cyclo-ligase [Planctomycetaceae bacterium]